MVQSAMACALQKEGILLDDYSKKAKQAIGIAANNHEGTAGKDADFLDSTPPVAALEIGTKVKIVGLEFYGGLSGTITGYNQSEYLVGIDCPDDGNIELENIDDWGGALLPKLLEVDARYHGLRYLTVMKIDGNKYIKAKASGGVLSTRIPKKHLLKYEE